MAPKIYLDIAVPTPLRRSFEYLPPPRFTHDQILALLPGIRIKVPFGHRVLIGILLQTKTESEFDESKLKSAIEILDKEPLLPEPLFKLALWSAHYYQHPIGDALASFLPKKLRTGAPAALTPKTAWRLTSAGKSVELATLKQAKKQIELLKRFIQQPEIEKDTLKADNVSPAIIKALVEKKYIELFDICVEPPSDSLPLMAESCLPLNHEQKSAVEHIAKNLTTFSTALLQGITGSGKTEVYLQLVEKVLAQGKQVLLLVPEIGLTPQITERFQRRFNCQISVLHSGLNDTERLEAWLRASLGHAKIVIGTRSALFTPLPSPGMIIVDEEHDSSFKQQDNFRYSAHDLAVMRAKAENIPLVMGSATPTLESLHNAYCNRYHHLKLTQRAGNATPPTFKIVDIRGQRLHEGLSDQLLHEIQQTLSAGNQAIIFLNRRGYAPALMCHHCGWVAECSNCDVRLTVHNKQGVLRCHHCDHQEHITRDCPECLSTELEKMGVGTQRTEEALTERFSNFPVIRIDRDSTSRKNALTTIIKKINEGNPAILVGTQMLAKGHHFPKVTLVAILDVDTGLFSPDFRAPEKMGQLLTQVAGRSGRADQPGQVLIQTHHADHPLLTTLTTEPYETYAAQLLKERQLHQLPPFTFMAIIKADAKHPDQARDFLSQARHWAEQLAKDIEFMGPLAPVIEKKSNRFRQQLLLQGTRRSNLQEILFHLVNYLEQHPQAKTVRWSIDVDPLDVF